jgi:predicted house-cleaning NTP pyrophosphatase (Maf/HAM1 superfamily)
MKEEILLDTCLTQVLMRAYNRAEMLDYVASGDPMDKAGAYAIQNSAFDPVEQITGCYANVVGLPLCHLAGLLKQSGVPFDESAVQGCRSGDSYNCRLVEKIRSLDAENR